MSGEHKSGQRKSTGRRSSILKRQGSCYLSEATETVEKTNTPLKRRVSFASTTTVRTIEALPWQSYLSDDSGSTSVNHNEIDVFGPNPSLLVNVNPQCPKVTPPPVVVDADVLEQEDEGRVVAKEHNKTIMFSQFDDSDCAMEITTNVSQLSHSWFDNEDAHSENSNVGYQNNPTSVDNFPHSKPHVIFPWNKKDTDSNEAEKTKIFLSSDDDNLEFTSNLTGFPSLSERFLKPDCGNSIIQHHDNFPKHLSDDYGMGDEMTADMEMTGVIETCSVPKRRSVLVDLTTNKNLTPIEEMSVSSMYVSDHEPSSQNKSLNFSQVCAKLEALGSDKKSVNNAHKNTNVKGPPNVSTASSKNNFFQRESLPHAETQNEDDPEISFNFRSSTDPNPTISQDNSFPSVTNSLRNSLSGKPDINSLKPSLEIGQKTEFTEDMEITENQIPPLQTVKTSLKNLNDIDMREQIGQDDERTLFNRSMEFTNTHLNSVVPHDQDSREFPNLPSSNNASVHVEEMEITECRTLTKKAKIWQLNIDNLNSSHQHQEDYKTSKESRWEEIGDNYKDPSIQSAHNTLYMGDMELTQCVNSKNSTDMKGLTQRTVELTSNHQSERTDTPVMTVYNTEDMNFTHNLNTLDFNRRDEKEDSIDIGRKLNPGEKTVFVGEMEMTKTVSITDMPAVSTQISDKDDIFHSKAELSQSQKSHNLETSKQNALIDGNSNGSKVEERDYQGKAESLHVSLMDNFLSSQELNLCHDADANESLHDSISLSAIAGMESPKESNSQDREKAGVRSVHSDNVGQQKRQLSPKDKIDQSMLEYQHNSFVSADGQKSSIGEDKLPFVEGGDRIGSLEKEIEHLVRYSGDNEDSLHDSISLSEIAGLKSPSKPNGQKVIKNDENNTSSCAENDQPKDNSQKLKLASDEGDKSMEFGKKESPQRNSQSSEQIKKREALRKSLCNEMMFPNMASKNFSAKSFSQFSKLNTIGVAKTNQSCPEAPSKNTPHIREKNDDFSSKMESEKNKTEGQLKQINMRLSSDFFESEGLLDDDCPTLEDAFDNVPLNESVQEDLVFSYMHSIIEGPGDEADDKVDEKNRENMEFSDVCKVMGIEYDAQQRQVISQKPIPVSSISDKLNVSLVVKPEVMILEDYVEQLQKEVLREQRQVKEDLDKFSHSPPQIYNDFMGAIKKRQDVSVPKSKVKEMTKRCKDSTRSKHNRHKADYLVELTLEQQKGHCQHKKDLNTILSDIDRIANVSAEIDKCMEDLNIISNTRSEIHHLQKKTVEFESETCQMRSHCDRLDKEIDELNKVSKNRLHQMRDDEEEELLFLDQISFMSSLSEWTLLKQTKTKWIFGFLSNTMILTVSLSDTKAAHHQLISDIAFRSRLSSKSTHWARISHLLMLSSLDKESLMKKFQSFNHLNKLIAHVSDLAGVSRDLCAELRDVHRKHHLKGDGLRVCIQVLSQDCQQSIEVITTLQPGSYTKQPLDWEANVLLSPLPSATVVDELRKVAAGPRYISRALETVLSLMAR